MIKKEDIKIGSVLQIRKVDLKDITDMPFIRQIDPKNIYDSFAIKVVDMVNGRCEIELAVGAYVSRDVDMCELAKVSVFANESANRKSNGKTDADRFKEITDKMSDTYKRKNSDYGNSFSKLFEECGMTYAYGHLAEKVERINSLRKNDAKVHGESMIDSLYDLANYSILTIMEIEKCKEHGTDEIHLQGLCIVE